jgi:hypothetical protein
MIKAELILQSQGVDSRNPISTLLLTYPRFIHSEFMTHRAFSRNASSSRAIKFETMVERIRTNPAMPTYWGSNKPGMQAGEELSESDIDLCKFLWTQARENAITTAKLLHEKGLHKQTVNRLLEPFSHITTLVTATEWENFFWLRIHPAAQPEFQELARKIYDTINFNAENWPKSVKIGDNDWHLPFIKPEEALLHLKDRIMLSVARCASTSYDTVDGYEMTLEKAKKVVAKLNPAGGPMHASPFEHQAISDWEALRKGEWGNFTFWRQLRHNRSLKYWIGE